MNTLCRAFVFFLVALSTQAFASDVRVIVEGVGSDRSAAIDNALGDALAKELGSHIFSVSTKSGDTYKSMSTSVASGRVDDFEVLEEREAFNGVHVRLAVTLSESELSQIAPKEVKTWSQRVDETRSLDMAQRTVRQYREVLNEFLVGPRHQLEAGYSFILRSYDVESVSSDQLRGHIYVDITVNQSWWNTYYQIISVLKPQGRDVFNEGPIAVDNGKRAYAGYSKGGGIDRSLRYDAAHPLPVRLSVGRISSKFTLYKNALLVSAHPQTMDTATSAHQQKQAQLGEIVLLKGNASAGNAVIDKQKSQLSCGLVEQNDSAVYCGERFTLKLSYKAKSEADILKVMNNGLRVELNLFGDACENDCRLFQDEGSFEKSQYELIFESIVR